jgi:pimeloyl-ACP methyl ester carboxylesterase
MYFEGSRAPLTFAVNERVNVPTAVAHFPGELLFPPQVWVERGYNVTQWTEMPRGGHFAALEQPELLADDLRCFFRQFR